MIYDALAANGINADRIAHRLYQGAAPPPGTAVREAGFDVLVLCAEEYQPKARSFPDVRVLHCPLRDVPYAGDPVPLTDGEISLAKRVAKQTTEAIRRGGRALVTCRKGLNRSGLITAMVLCELTGWSMSRCIRHIQASRPDALFNTDFHRILRS